MFLLFFIMLGVGFVFADSTQQCPASIDLTSLIDFKVKSDDDILRKIAQKLIDLWLAVVKFVIETVCNLFQSLGFHC